MNLLTCNLFASGLPPQNVSQKKHFHHASTHPLHNYGQTTNKHFENPNFFYQKSLDKNIPSSYKHSDLSKNTSETSNHFNSSDMITEKTKQTNCDNLLIEAVNNISTKENIHEMEASVSCPKKAQQQKKPIVTESELEASESDDSFIVFESEEGGTNDQELSQEESVEDDSSSDDEESSEDDDDDDSFIIHCRSNKKERLPSVTESEDSFIVFDRDENDPDEEIEESEEMEDEDDIVDDEEEDEDDGEKKCKSDNGKKVSFVDGPELCTVHLMIKWSFAYRKARKGLWEQFARDNERFKFRALNFGASLNRFLQPEHRLKVYEERFKDRKD